MTWLLVGVAVYLLYRWVDDISAKEKRKLAARRAKKIAKPLPPPPELVGGRRAHVILGVDEDASIEEVRAAYQRLMKDHHPDRVARLGGAEQRRAEAKAKRLNLAYEIMKSEVDAPPSPPPAPKPKAATKRPTPKRS